MNKKKADKKEEQINHIEDEALKSGKKEKSNFEDEVIRAFDPILDSDEKVIKAYKPCKAVIYATNICSLTIPFLVLGLFLTLVFCLPGQAPATNVEIILAAVIPTSLYLMSLALLLVFNCYYHKNTFFAYTNKRIIICSGVLGVDYRSLDLENIAASNVTVSVLDKLLKKNTGTIRFNGSAVNGAISYAFTHIEKPYEVYKEIKNYIEEQKKQNK